MARPPRPRIADGTYHVTSNGARDEIIFPSGADRAKFLLILGRVVERHRWRCLAYCILGTHYHLLVQTPDPDIDRGMQRLNSAYALTYNRRYTGRGAVFRERYGSALVEDEQHLYRAHRYIALNPCRAGLVPAPELWPWSSYGAVMEAFEPPPFLDVAATLELFGADAAVARARLREFVEAERDLTRGAA